MNWDSLKQAYINESMDRDVLWVLRDYPELKETAPNPEIDEDRSRYIISNLKLI
jgi:hypothetical protein